MTLAQPDREIWFLTGSQALYGDDTLAQVADQSRAICDTLAGQPRMTVRLVWKPVLTDAAAIRAICLEANADDRCIGLIAWMHTFSPAKMWISRPRRPEQAPAPPAHPGQPPTALVHHRHGLHEPEPGRPR